MPSGVREPTIPLICNVCGKHFLGRTKTDKYCSKECQKISMRQLKNEHERLKSIEKYKNDPDALTCKECGYMGHDLSNHIKRLHMPIEDYCKKHNCDKFSIISKKKREESSERNKQLIKEGKVKCFTSTYNPGLNHGGRLSAWSKKFVKYENITDPEELDKLVEQRKREFVNSKNENCNNPLRVDYYIKRGATPEEAEQLLKEHQTTFSLKICIEKYGLEEGCKRFASRQKNWQHTLVSNPESNARQIAGRIKATEVSFSNRSNKEYVEKQKQTRPYKGCYSIVSQEFFDLLLQVLKDEYNKEFPDVRYASVNSEFKVYIDDTHFRLLDFYIPSLNKAIEFDGTYWHKDGYEYDKQREFDIEKVLSGIKFYRIDESEFRNDPYKIILGAINFILSN